MNIHPLFVHFPIGLLVVYTLVELASSLFVCVRRQAWVSPVKQFLLFTGVLAAFVALATGGMAEDLVAGVNPRSFIIDVHAPFAAATTLLYIILASGYLIRLFDTRGWAARVVANHPVWQRLWSMKKYLAHLVLDTWARPVLALLALVGITITGALGAALVYGPNIDPFVLSVYQLFW